MSQKGYAVMLSLLVCLSGCLGGEPEENEVVTEFYGLEYQTVLKAPEFTLINQHGKIVSLSDFEGKVVVVAFIYTYCPDVCLIISSNLDYVNDNLGEESDDVILLSITIDPARDTVSYLGDWTQTMGYDWNHLTGTRSELEPVWESWQVVIDDDHITNSTPPEGAMNRLAVLFPDNSTMTIDHLHSELGFQATGTELADAAFESAEVQYNSTSERIGDWQANQNWSWELYIWNGEQGQWNATQLDLDQINVSSDTHLAWAASNANLSHLPPGADCNGHGWIMGSGGGAHCMCDEGWTRPSDDWLTCVPENEAEQQNQTDADPHADYTLGHGTVTYILDKDLNKRLAFAGIGWDADEFLHDVRVLVNE